MKLPSSEQVAVGWFKLSSALDPTKVATTVPADSTVWAETGFLQIMGLGGAANIEFPYRKPTFQVSAWAVSPSSTNPPWGKAAELAERAFGAFYDSQMFPADLSILGNYRAVRVVTGFVLSEPRKIFGDIGAFAQITFDAALHWVVSD